MQNYFPDGTPSYPIPTNSLVCDLYQNATKQILDGSIDCVIIDPPYTDGKTDALPNHKIQTKIDIEHVMGEAFRVLKKDGFFVFFGQFPTILAWLNEASKKFRYKEHITWAKRNVTSPYLLIQRCKEEIFVFAKGNPKYHETKAKYEDLKTPALHLGVYELSTMLTTISDLQRRVRDNAYNMMYYQGIGVDNSLEGLEYDMPKSDLEVQKDTANNDIWRAKKLDKAVRQAERIDFDELDKHQKQNRSLSDKRNDPLIQDAFQKTLDKRAAAGEDFGKIQKLDTVGYQDGASNDSVYTKNRDLKSAHRYRSKHWCNVLNLWTFIETDEDKEHGRKIKLHAKVKKARPATIFSYLSQNQTKMGKKGENWKHPTVKPILCLERLIDMLTPKATPELTPIILDMFVGSGTTALAAQRMKRAYIGIESQRDYYEISKHRLEQPENNGGKAVQSVVVPAAAKPAPEPPKDDENQLLMF